MPSFRQLPSGNWRAQVRRKGRYAAATFRRKKDAQSWALETERRIDRGEFNASQAVLRLETVGDLIALHIADMQEVNKPLRRSKAYSLNLLKARIGSYPIKSLDRTVIIAFGRSRAKEGAGPVTLAAELSYIGTILSHAAAIHGVETRREDVDLARIALARLGLVGRGNERDRRPTQHELDRLFAYFEGNAKLTIAMSRIVKFAIATAMRVSEITEIEWTDVDSRLRTVVVRDRKDPRKKEGNNQRVPLIDDTGYNAWSLLEEQRGIARDSGRIFPYNERSIGTAFRRACKKLRILDLRFHDLRHEATSRLFEAGLTIERVALVSGHKDWKMLRRYTHLKPEALSERKIG
jgi:integrase